MKIAYIGTYIPRECGIGTFTHNLFNSMLPTKENQSNVNEGYVIALNNNGIMHNYPEQVKLTIRQDHQEDYINASKFINLSSTDLCILQHEFGIFGGQSGAYILPLLHNLEVPFIVTLHTILKDPSYNEKDILQGYVLE